MSESTLAVPGAAVRIWRDVVNDVVRMRSVSRKNLRRAGHALELIEIERVACSPGDHVIGA
jgi:hypothetical protein